jgi:predicted Na+-dependent transporter
MKKYWIVFAFAVVVGASFFFLPNEQRQEVAKYIAICLLSAFFLRPIGLTIGQILRKLLSKE